MYREKGYNNTRQDVSSLRRRVVLVPIHRERMMSSKTAREWCEVEYAPE